MNKAYRSIYNEKLGTFVAVAENVKARGKKSSSARKGVLAAAVASALALSTGGVLADVEIPDTGNVINFTTPGGSINFGAGGSITGLAGLTINGALTADQLTVGGKQIATSEQVFDLSDRVTTTETGVTELGDRVDTAETDIADLDGRVDVNERNINAINTSLTELGVDADKPGVKYFRANSTESDAVATGMNSVAIGPNAKSEGANSLAVGNHADAREANSLAVGNGAISDGESAIALGDGAKISKPTNGSNPVAAIAIGMNSESSGTASTAIGKEANASGTNAVAFGSSATAAGASSVALGHGAQAMAQENISIGKGAGFNSGDVIPGDQKQNIAIGVNAGSDVSGQINAALGYAAGQNVKGNDNVAVGRSAGSGIEGTDNISIGQNANINAVAHRAIGIGQNTKAETEGVAIGFESGAGNKGVAIGRHAQATGTGIAIGPDAKAASGYVALGLGSIATQGDISAENSRFTNRSFSGSAVSVGSSAQGNVFTRRIVNVEDGANDTDAVNVRQLQQAVSGIDLSNIDFAGGVIKDLQDQIDQNMLEYVSINDGGTDKGNKNNNGAQATDSMALGPDATANKANSIAIGHKAGAEGESAVVLGHNIKGLGANSMTIGNSNSEARDVSGIAIGTKVTSRDENSIVIGRDSYTDRQGAGPSVKNSIVIGTASSSTAEEGIVLGKDSIVNASKGIAQGSNAHATAENAMAFGTGSRASAVDSQASGTGAHAYAQRGVAIGQGARSGEANPQVDNAVNNRDSIAIGSESLSKMNSSTAIGKGAQATANFAQAFGENAQASGAESIAQGRNARTIAQQAIAVGSNAQALHARSIALGDGAVTDGAVGTSNATLNNLAYGNFAGDKPIATVSVGTATEKRTITNVAAGRISGTSTDAINGSQLFATNTVLGKVANSTKTSIGGETTIAPDGTITTINVGDTGKNNIHDAIKYAAQGWQLATADETGSHQIKPGETAEFDAGKNLEVSRESGTITYKTKDDVEFTNVDVTNKITVAGNTTINEGGVTTNKVTSNEIIVNHEGDSINVGETLNKGITFVGDDGEKTEQKLGSELTVAGDENIHTTVEDGKVQVSLDKNLTSLESVETSTINVGGGTFVAGDNKVTVGAGTTIDMGNNQITNVAAGTENNHAVNLGQLKDVDETANKGWNLLTNNEHDSLTQVKPGDDVDFRSGKNIEVTQDGLNVTVATAADVEFDSVESTIVNVTEELTVANNTTINEGGITSNNLTVTGETKLGDHFYVDNSGAHYDGDITADTHIVNKKYITERDNELIEKGLDFAGNDGQVIHKDLGQQMNIVGGMDVADASSSTNLKTVKNADGDLEIQLSKNLTDLETITVDNTITIGSDVTNQTIINEGGITSNNLTVTGETKLGDHFYVDNSGAHYDGDITADTHVVNKKYITERDNELIEKGLDFAGNDGEVIHKDLGQQMNIVGGMDVADASSSTNLKTVKNADGDLEIQLSKNLTDLETITVDNTITIGSDVTNQTIINESGITSNNLTVTGETKLGDHFYVDNSGAHYDGDITADTHIVNKKYITERDNELIEKGLDFAGNDGQVIHKNLGEQLNIVGGMTDMDAGAASAENIRTVMNDDGDLEVQLSKNLGNLESVESTIVNVTEELTVANNTTINEGGITSNNLTVTGETKLGDNFHVTNEGDVTYAGPITEGDHIVNKTYVDQAGEDLTNLGLNFAGNKGADVHRNLGQTLDIKGGATTVGTYSSANLQTVTTADGIELHMAEAPKFGEITINNEGRITGVEAGKDGKDAVNFDQLEEGLAAAKTEVKAGKNIEVTTESEDPSVYIVKTEDNVEFDSVTSEDDDGNKTVLNPEGVTIAGPDDTIQATQLGSTQITVGGSNPIVMNGNTGMITGLTNQNWSSPSFADGSGRAATEEQLKPLGDFLGFEDGNYTFNYNGKDHKDLASALDSIHWNVQAPEAGDNNGGNTGSGSGSGGSGGSGGTTSTPITNGNTVGFVGDENITVSKTERDDKDGANIHVNLNPDVTVDSVTVNNGGPVINQGGINMGGNNITNLAPGVNGTDAVNVDQLDKVKETAEKGWNVSTQGGAATQVKPGDTVDFANKDGNIVVANNGTNVTVDLAKDIAVSNIQVDNSVTVGGKTNNQTIIKDGSVTTNEVIIKRPGNPDGDMNVGETLNKGITFVGTEGQSERKLGDTLEIVGANDNITTKVNGPKGILEIALSNDLAIDSVTINNGGPIINDNGINMVDNRITNVADGIDVGDAVNMGQLGKVQDNLQGQVNHLRHDIRRMDKKLSAGVAAAMATAGLPQAYLPGKSMMAMSGGVWNGESGMAIGFSTITDSGKWVVKAAGNATGRGDYGGTVGVGYQW